MTISEYEKVSAALLAEADAIAKAKRPGYTLADNDVLINFKAVAKRLDVTPMQAWGVYFLKHIDAITSLARDPKIPQAEEMVGRFSDAINYLQLGYALYYENFGRGGERVDEVTGLGASADEKRSYHKEVLPPLP